MYNIFNYVKNKFFKTPSPVTYTLEKNYNNEGKLKINEANLEYVRMLQTKKAMLDDPSHCENILHLIPHYNNTTEHWFNGVMASFFASERMRSMMIYKSKFWTLNQPITEKTPERLKKLQEFYNAVKMILFDYKTATQTQLQMAFEKINPRSLTQLMSMFNNRIQGNSMSHQTYVETFSMILSIRTVSMVYVRGLETDRLYVNPLARYDKYQEVQNILEKNKKLKDDGGVDVLWITNLEDIEYSDRKSIVDFIHTMEQGYPEYTSFSIPGFERHAHGAQIYDQNYIKDVVFPTSLDKAGNVYKSLSEDMIGITCNGNKYIFNIWISHLPQLNAAYGVPDNDKRPKECKLVPYDWVTNPSISFKLDKKACDIERFERPESSLGNKLEIDKTLSYRLFVCVNEKYNRRPSDIISILLNESDEVIVDAENKSDLHQQNKTVEKPEDPSTVQFDKTTPEKNELSQISQTELNEFTENIKINPKLEDPRTLLCLRRVDNFSKLESYYKFTQPNWNAPKFLEDLPMTSPKLKMLLDKIKELDERDLKEHGKKHKHFIYSDLQHGYGTTVIASGLIALGRHLIFGKGRDWFLRDSDNLNDFQGKEGFGILTKGSLFTKNPMSVKLQSQILSAYNSRPYNVHGQNVQIIIVDRDFKEGIDLHDVRYVHIFEPQEHESQTKQVIGRSTRMCGQVGLKFIPNIGWPLDIYVYNTLLSTDLQKILNVQSSDANTLFQLYINNKGVNLKELNFLSELEKTCIEGSVDHELNYRLHDSPLIGADSPKAVYEFMTTAQQGGGSPVFQDMFIPFLAIRNKNALAKMRRLLSKHNDSWLNNDSALKYLEKLQMHSEFYRFLLESYKRDPLDFVKRNDKIIRQNLRGPYKILKEIYANGFNNLNRELTGGFKKFKHFKKPFKKPERFSPTEPKEATAPPPVQEVQSTPTVDPKPNSDKPQPPSVTNAKTDIDIKDSAIDYKEDDLTGFDEVITQDQIKYDTPESFTEFKNLVNEKYSQFSWAQIEIKNECNTIVPTIPVFTPTQDFVRHYFNPFLQTVKGMLLWHSVGTGKCHALNTPILMHDGSIRLVQDIKVGEMLMGDDSTPRTVLTLARGQDEMYDVIPETGDTYTVNKEHILVLKYIGDVDVEGFQKDQVVEMEVKDFIRLPKHVKENMKGMRTGTNFKSQIVEFDPYFFGVWIGDGTNSPSTVTINNPTIMSNYSKELCDYGFRLSPLNNNKYAVLVNENSQSNISTFIQNNDLKHIKRIPKQFLINNVDTRMSVLAGFIDSVGLLSKKHNHYELNVKNKDLVHNILFLARSLGLGAYNTKFIKSFGISEEIHNHIVIYGDIHKIPVKLVEKTSVPSNKNPLLTSINVAYKKQDNYYGFTLDGNNRYLLGDFTITHNTCTAIATATTSFVPHGYDILWVTRSSLRPDIEKNMYQTICNMQVRDYHEKHGNVPEDGKTRRKIIGSNWRLQTLSHSQFTNMLSGKNQGFFNRLMGREQLKQSDDPLHKTLVIVDEAHRLYKPGSGTHHAEIADMETFYNVVQNSYEKSGNDSVKLLLMTATPITDDPMDLIKLINLIRPRSMALPDKIDRFERAYLDNVSGRFTNTGRKNFINDIAGNISYLNRSNDPRAFAQPQIFQLYAPMSTTDIIGKQNRLAELAQEYKILYEQLKGIEDTLQSTKNRISYVSKHMGSGATEVIALRENLIGMEESRKVIIVKLKKIQNDINTLKKNPIDKNDKSQEAVIINSCLKQPTTSTTSQS